MLLSLHVSIFQSQSGTTWVWVWIYAKAVMEIAQAENSLHSLETGPFHSMVVGPKTLP